MYSKDFRIKHILAIFFAIAISHELSILVGILMPFLSIIHSLSLFIILIFYNNLNKHIWNKALGIVGFFSILYIMVLILGYHPKIFRIISSVINILVWIKCIGYLTKNQENHNNDQVIDDQDELKK